MESSIFRNITVLRKVSIIMSIITVSLFFGITFAIDEGTPPEGSKATDAPYYGSPIMSFLLILLFVAPASVAGVAASFFNNTKKQIIIWCAITIVIWGAILLIGLMMLVYPTSFDLPENYWNVDT